MAKSRETSWGRTELIEQGVERTGTQAGAYMYPLRQPGQQSVSPRNSRATTRQQANRNKWARWDIRSTIEVFGERKRPASAEWLSAHDARTLLSVCAIRVTPTRCPYGVCYSAPRSSSTDTEKPSRSAEVAWSPGRYSPCSVYSAPCRARTVTLLLTGSTIQYSSMPAAA
jgi:hypothetical protein